MRKSIKGKKLKNLKIRGDFLSRVKWEPLLLEGGVMATFDLFKASFKLFDIS